VLLVVIAVIVYCIVRRRARRDAPVNVAMENMREPAASTIPDYASAVMPSARDEAAQPSIGTNYADANALAPNGTDYAYGNALIERQGAPGTNYAAASALRINEYSNSGLAATNMNRVGNEYEIGNVN